MNCRKLALSLVAILSIITAGTFSIADEDGVPTDKEVMEAEGTPPLIPHKSRQIKGKNEDESCLYCHEDGKNNAPQTPHAERRGCTQCHVFGSIVPEKKGKKGIKR